jgi:hypothetical protein
MTSFRTDVWRELGQKKDELSMVSISQSALRAEWTAARSVQVSRRQFAQNAGMDFLAQTCYRYSSISETLEGFDLRSEHV